MLVSNLDEEGKALYTAIVVDLHRECWLYIEGRDVALCIQCSVIVCVVVVVDM